MRAFPSISESGHPTRDCIPTISSPASLGQADYPHVDNPGPRYPLTFQVQNCRILPCMHCFRGRRICMALCRAQPWPVPSNARVCLSVYLCAREGGRAEPCAERLRPRTHRALSWHGGRCAVPHPGLMDTNRGEHL